MGIAICEIDQKLAMERSINKLRRVFRASTCVRFLTNIAFDVYFLDIKIWLH